MFNNGSNGLWIGWQFNFKPFLGVKFFLLLHHYQKLFKTMFGKFLPRLFLNFSLFQVFMTDFLVNSHEFHESLTINFFAAMSVWLVGYVVRIPDFHADDPSMKPIGDMLFFTIVKAFPSRWVRTADLSIRSLAHYPLGHGVWRRLGLKTCDHIPNVI